MVKYTAYYNNGKDFEYTFDVDDSIKYEDQLEHVDERAQKLAEAHGWGYAGISPKLESKDLQIESKKYEI